MIESISGGAGWTADAIGGGCLRRDYDWVMYTTSVKIARGKTRQ